MGFIDTTKNQWVQNEAIDDLAGGADVAATVVVVNAILAALRDSGIIAES